MLVISIKLERVKEFTLIRNIIYISLIKCKKVTYIILASELYIIIIRIDILITLSSIINIITDKLRIK